MRLASWEQRLIDWAYEGIRGPSGEVCDGLKRFTVMQGYELGADITRQHSRTFLLASGLLPREKRRAARVLYAFCRTTDDIVDVTEDDASCQPQCALDAWRDRALNGCADEGDALIHAWADVQANHGIPRLYAEQLIEGVSRDLVQFRYDTFDDLTAYCYGVASTVGLMAMHIIGFSGSEAVPYAVRLGVALQMTNILRDVGEDWRAGRLYLPREELAAFGLSEFDIAQGTIDERWRTFMRFQIDRVRQLYADALPGIGYLHQDGRFAIGAAAELYRAILEDIEAHDMDVFRRRATVSTLGKLRRLPGVWWRASVAGYGRQAPTKAGCAPKGGQNV